MISPAGMAIAAITVMMWIVWSDGLRPRKPTPILYTMRIALYLIVSGVFVLNMVRYPRMFTGTARVLSVVAVVVGVAGSVYFTRKLVSRGN